MSPGSLAFPEKWHREGRGITAEVEGLTADPVERAIGALPREWAPYVLLVVNSTKQGRHYVDVVQVADTVQLDERAADGQWYYFLWSPLLTPALVEPLGSQYVDSRALSLSGLVNIQYRRQFRGRELPTRDGCVHKIRSDEGELILHSEYEKVYRSLLRSLRKARV